MEPPPFYFPVRQALGAVLLESGRAAEAEQVYRKDLSQYPKNGWSLYGLARSLEAQGKSDEASWADQGHRNAFAQADVSLEASRF
jgi:predicted Zn-dependent protease